MIIARYKINYELDKIAYLLGQIGFIFIYNYNILSK